MSELPGPERIRELADRARALASSELYPAVVGGLVVYSLMEYVDSGRLIDAFTVSTAVIEHAEANGWTLRLDPAGFWEAAPPPTISVHREPHGMSWKIDTPSHAYSTAALTGYLAENIRDAAGDNGLVRVRYRDGNTLEARRQRELRS